MTVVTSTFQRPWLCEFGRDAWYHWTSLSMYPRKNIIHKWRVIGTWCSIYDLFLNTQSISTFACEWVHSNEPFMSFTWHIRPNFEDLASEPLVPYSEKLKPSLSRNFFLKRHWSTDGPGFSSKWMFTWRRYELSTRAHSHATRALTPHFTLWDCYSSATHY